jgi:hypothetical protein
LRGVCQMAPSLIGETYLEAIVGHCGLDSGGGKKSGNITVRRCDARVKREEQI